MSDMSDKTKDITQILRSIAGIEIEAVLGGCLQRVTFSAGTNPAQVGDMLRALDPAAKLRDDFPSRGSWGGSRETKTARVLSISARNTSSGKFIELGCIAMVDGKEKDIPISVGKDDSEGWLSAVLALNKLSDTQADELTKALTTANGKASVNLRKAENQFGAEYYTSKSGGCYLSKMTAEAPQVDG